MAPGDVGIHLFQPNFPHISLQLGVIPGPTLPPPGLIALDLPRHPMVETPQNPPDTWGQDPSLCTKEQDGLHYGEVKMPQNPSVYALPPQDH